MVDQVGSVSKYVSQEAVTYEAENRQNVGVKINGQEARLQLSPTSLLADAQEEIGFMRATTGDINLKNGKPIKQALDNRNTIVTLANNYLDSDAASDMVEAGTPNQMLSKLKKTISEKQSESEATRQLDMVLDEFGYKSKHDQFSALLKLQSAIKSDSADNRHLAQLINIKITNTKGDDASLLRASFNIIDRVRQENDLGRPTEIIKTYFNVVVKGGTLSEVYKKIVQQHGLLKYKKSISLLVGAAGDDIDSIGSSTHKEKLESSIGALSKLQLMSSVQKECDDSISKLHGWLKPNLKEYVFLESLLTLIDNQWPLSSDVLALCPVIVVNKPQANVAFLNQLSFIARIIPEAAFEDETIRENFIDAVKAANDEGVRVEELELSGG